MVSVYWCWQLAALPAQCWDKIGTPFGAQRQRARYSQFFGRLEFEMDLARVLGALAAKDRIETNGAINTVTVGRSTEKKCANVLGRQSWRVCSEEWRARRVKGTNTNIRTSRSKAEGLEDGIKA